MPAPVEVVIGGDTSIPHVLAITGITSPVQSGPLILPQVADVGGFPAWGDGNFAMIYDTDSWYLSDDGASNYEATLASTADTPLGLTGWTITAGTGQPVIAARAPDPVTAVIEGAEVALQATLTTALTGANNDLTYTAALGGRLGNGWRIRYVDPAANSQTIAVTVEGQDVTVSLATDGSGVITSTAEQVETALNLVDAFAVPLLVNVALGNDGTGVVTAMAFTALAGGTGGLPPAPVEVTI